MQRGLFPQQCASDLNNPEHQNEIFQMKKQMVKERQDITGSNCLKGVSGKVNTDKNGIKDSQKQYTEKGMNEENERDYTILAEVKDGPVDCIMIDEVAVALKKIKGIKPQVCQG